MQDEGFTELVLLSCKPTPKVPKPPATSTTTKRTTTRSAALPEVVTLEVGLVDIEWEGTKDRFYVWRFEAHDMVRWESSGPLGKHEEFTIERADDVAAAIALRFVAGGVALLACGHLAVVDGGPRLRAARPRPWQNSVNFYCHGETTIGALLKAVDVSGVHVQSFDERPVFAEASATLSSLHERSGRAWRFMDGEREIATFYGSQYLPYWLLSLGRGQGATDGEWDRCWAVPVALARNEVWSRTFRTTKEAWAQVDWRNGVPPAPRRP